MAPFVSASGASATSEAERSQMQTLSRHESRAVEGAWSAKEGEVSLQLGRNATNAKNAMKMKTQQEVKAEDAGSQRECRAREATPRCSSWYRGSSGKRSKNETMSVTKMKNLKTNEEGGFSNFVDSPAMRLGTLSKESE